MPIYEYGCYDCKKRVNIFWRAFSEAETETPKCPRCGGTNLKRLVSKVSVLRSEDSRLESLADPSKLSEDDPKSLGRWMKEMSSEMGEDPGPEFNEVIDRLEAGQSPEEIEQTVPGLADNAPGGGAADDWFG
ncbi:MAG TPA: zinc ribbon domain-containing protein [Chloroflexi bacterium]|nr:zinc ribbon domain-containing protein [Chloroflexota bacterium]